MTPNVDFEEATRRLVKAARAALPCVDSLTYRFDLAAAIAYARPHGPEADNRSFDIAEAAAFSAGYEAGKRNDRATADYDRAIGIMVRTRRASTSFLQREIGVTYNAAARLMEWAEADGIVSKPDAVGKRHVAIAPAARGDRA